MKILAALARACDVVERSNSATRELDAVADVNQKLAQAVAAHGAPPLVLAGNCNSCLGTLAGLHRDAGIIWFDAHGDFNTPETTVSGALEGMSLAIATGGCHQHLRRQIGLEQPVPESDVLLVAARSLDPEEKIRLDGSQVRVIRLADLSAAIAGWDKPVYLHLDLDVLDPRLSPGVNFAEPGGLTPEQLYTAVREIAGKLPIAAATIANFNPDRDQHDRTLQIALCLVGILGDASLT
jgi:arginase